MYLPSNKALVLHLLIVVSLIINQSKCIQDDFSSDEDENDDDEGDNNNNNNNNKIYHGSTASRDENECGFNCKFDRASCHRQFDWKLDGNSSGRERVHRHRQHRTNSSVGYILGGLFVDNKEFPQYAQILATYSNGKLGKACGSTIVSPWHVITALHCVRDGNQDKLVGPGDVKIFTGDTRNHFWSGATYSQRWTQKNQKICYHPDAAFIPNKLNVHYDIALITLNIKILMKSPYEDIACVERLKPEDEEYCYAVGTGDTSPLGEEARYVLKFPVYRVDYCWSHLDGLECWRTVENKSSPCYGDSGGPIMCKSRKTGKWHLAGVLSMISTDSQGRCYYGALAGATPPFEALMKQAWKQCVPRQLDPQG